MESNNVAEIRPSSREQFFAELEGLLPSGHQLNNENIIERKDYTSKGDVIVTELCSPVMVSATTYSDDGKEGGILIKWIDRANRVRQQSYPQQILATPKALIESLMRQRVIYITSNTNDQKKFVDYLQRQLPDKQILYVQKLGWTMKNSFVFGDEILGNEEVIYQPLGPKPESLKIVGNVEDWNELFGKYCVNNPVLTVAVLSSLASPLLGLLGKDGSIFHAIGKSSTGKSIALGVSCSVFGKEKDVWKTTDNRMENKFEASSGVGIQLDEMGEATPKAVENIAYMLANGKGKGRMNPDGSSQRDRTWSLNAFSTGEITIGQKISMGGSKITGGVSVRCVEGITDIYDYGCFNDIHDFESGEAFAKHLETCAGIKGGRYNPKASGALGYEFVKCLQNTVEENPNIISEFIEHIKVNVNAMAPMDCDSQVKRMCDGLCILVLAGELAIEFGLLDWSGDTPYEMCKKFLLDSVIPTRGSIESKEESNAIEQVTDFMDLYHMSHFTPLKSDDCEKPIISSGHHYGWYEGYGENRMYYITAAGWKEITKGLNQKAVTDALIKNDMLVPGKDYIPQQKKINGKNTRVYAIKY
ncbi:DUF927 domain-containing protein (plasmid) [Vibrio harveyi]|uniref:DUF927 domain-containing protein n=1 Tax=Vibrio harveyi TaxID=669 RepID=UPI00234C46AD|nr:DUF927 domain-containing protein [Vibrio harveyi]WCP84209.1 DUF927 domain-containing protein [Vibrio harveyi]